MGDCLCNAMMKAVQSLHNVPVHHPRLTAIQQRGHHNGLVKHSTYSLVSPIPLQEPWQHPPVLLRLGDVTSHSQPVIIGGGNKLPQVDKGVNVVEYLVINPESSFQVTKMLDLSLPLLLPGCTMCAPPRVSMGLSGSYLHAALAAFW